MPEFVSRNGRRSISSAKQFQRWNDLPYGIWRCKDGRDVLFNRYYEPIYQRFPDGTLEDADPAEWINWSGQEWFYTDADSEAQKRRKAESALAAFMAAPMRNVG